MGSPLNRDNAEQNSRGWYSTEPMMGASLLSAGVLGGMLNGFGDPKVDNRRGADSVPHQGSRIPEKSSGPRSRGMHL
jgi:hypothetical protein